MIDFVLMQKWCAFAKEALTSEHGLSQPAYESLRELANEIFRGVEFRVWEVVECKVDGNRQTLYFPKI